MHSAFFHSALFAYFVLPLLIFAIRIVDVSFDTLRIVFISRGNKVVAPILGFFGVLVWLIAITQIMQHLDNFLCYIAYAGGFATGNLIGLIIEEKLAIGFQVIRIITSRDSTPLIENLKSKGYGVTAIWAEGKEGKVHIIFSIVKRGDVQNVISIINVFNPKAFYSIEDIRSLNIKRNLFSPGYKIKNRYRWLRKGMESV